VGAAMQSRNEHFQEKNNAANFTQSHGKEAETAPSAIFSTYHQDLASLADFAT